MSQHGVGGDTSVSVGRASAPTLLYTNFTNYIEGNIFGIARHTYMFVASE